LRAARRRKRQDKDASEQGHAAPNCIHNPKCRRAGAIATGWLIFASEFETSAPTPCMTRSVQREGAMNRRRWNAVVWLVLLAAGALVGACRKTYTYAVVPRPNGAYRPDTLRAFQNGNEVFVIFRFDTVRLTRTRYVTDTLWREGTRIIRDTLRLVRRDTVRVVRRDTIRVTKVDTVRIQSPGAVRVGVRDTVVITRTRVDTLQGPVRYDTVRVYRVDTVSVRVPRVDTVRVTRVDTVRVAGPPGASKRTLRVPPGQYPPEGQCRVWIEGVPPGRQRDAAACDALGDIPAGAFVLFGGEAYDFDYDWVANPSGAPPQIIALKRRR
jgi:hypothetical protein